ncbi:MAG: MBL fold metallo-hydrolase [Pseudomonadota bacterium]
MSVSFVSLGSGSNGNSTLVRVDDTLLLVDAGFSAKSIAERLNSTGIDVADISAIIVSHEHSDHVKGVGVLSRKYGLPVWLTRGTYRRLKDTKLSSVEFIHPHGSFCIGDAKVTPFPVPHDAAEPCQYIIGDGVKRLAIATDMGYATSYVRQLLSGVDALLLEANYDFNMLQSGPYPYALQNRIDGRFGHLSNDQSALLAADLEHPGLQRLFLGHLSENNNTPRSALESVANRLSKGDENLCVLRRAALNDWFSIA